MGSGDIWDKGSHMYMGQQDVSGVVSGRLSLTALGDTRPSEIPAQIETKDFQAEAAHVEFAQSSSALR